MSPLELGIAAHVPADWYWHWHYKHSAGLGFTTFHIHYSQPNGRYLKHKLVAVHSGMEPFQQQIKNHWDHWTFLLQLNLRFSGIDMDWLIIVIAMNLLIETNHTPFTQAEAPLKCFPNKAESPRLQCSLTMICLEFGTVFIISLFPLPYLHSNCET